MLVNFNAISNATTDTCCRNFSNASDCVVEFKYSQDPNGVGKEIFTNLINDKVPSSWKAEISSVCRVKRYLLDHQSCSSHRIYNNCAYPLFLRPDFRRNSAVCGLEFCNVDGVRVDFDFDCASRGGCQFRLKRRSGVELLRIIEIVRLMGYNRTSRLLTGGLE